MIISNPSPQNETYNAQEVYGDGDVDSTGRRRILVLGATGTIGRATVRALVQRDHDVFCLVRARSGPRGAMDTFERTKLLSGATVRTCDPTNSESITRDGICGERFDAMISCLASRTGRPRDAWAIDHDAHIGALAAAKQARIPHMILLSAICVQKPRLEFQRAKLAFEQALISSGLTFSIVRPTAFFKSLSGQVDRVRQGKPFLLFGDGRLTACKPISDADLGNYLADCLNDVTRHNRILPIGGPGEAITPRDQGEALFGLLGHEARFRQVPVELLDAIVAILGMLGRLVPKFADKAELARIGRYYATESMLVLNSTTGNYDADATPSTGAETLFNFYRALIEGGADVERGDHAVF